MVKVEWFAPHGSNPLKPALPYLGQSSHKITAGIQGIAKHPLGRPALLFRPSLGPISLAAVRTYNCMPGGLGSHYVQIRREGPNYRQGSAAAESVVTEHLTIMAERFQTSDLSSWSLSSALR